MITIDDVSRNFQHNGGPIAQILADVAFTVPEGQFLCLLGPSGCGKTTLLNLLAGFIAPSTGRLLLKGRPIVSPGPDRGVVFQEPTLFPWLTVLENVQFGLKRQGVKGRSLSDTAYSYLNHLGLSEHADKFPFALSGGMRQRVAIARVLALEPEVLLMDEPFSALDANTRERLQDELLRVWLTKRRTVVYVTHSVEEAAYMADRVIVLGHCPARVYEDIPVSLDRPRDRSRADFIAIKSRLRSCLATQPCCIQPHP